MSEHEHGGAAKGQGAKYSDAEIQSMEEDTLGRSEFASRIADRITNAGAGPSTVFGLSGPWGSGKSSTLNMITEIIDGHHSESWRIARFTPWASSDLDDLTSEFYTAVASALPDGEGNEAKTLLARATPFAAAIGKAAVSALVDRFLGEGGYQNVATAGAESLADEATKIALQQQTFDQRFADLSKAIDRAGYQILVVIDDIDRLHGDELLVVMKAVRLLGRFNRVHYLLCYDEATVLDVLKDTDIAGGERGRARRYLEKIIQFPFVLPPIQPQHLQNQLRAQLETVADAHGITLDEDLESSVNRVVECVPDFRTITLRSIYRWANQVEVLVALVGPSELNLADAALITYLRVFQNDVYVKVPEWRSDLVAREQSYVSMSDDKPIDKNEWEKRVRSALGDTARNADVAESLAILGVSFPVVGRGDPYSTKPYAISNRRYFDRYFALGIPLDDVRDTEVSTDLRHLATDGRFQTDSVIRDSAQNGKEFLVANKMLGGIRVIDDALPQPAFSAAQNLMRLFSARSGRYKATASVIYRLLGHAVANSPEQEERKSFMCKFEQEFGLVETADILKRPDADETPYDDVIREATSEQRNRMVAACIHDLQTEIHPGEPGVLELALYLEVDQWAEVRAGVESRLASGACNLADLAARFVRFSPAITSNGVAPYFSSEFFEMLFPRDAWSQYPIPGSPSDPFTLTDCGLADRIAWATHCLHEETRHDRNSAGGPPK